MMDYSALESKLDGIPQVFSPRLAEMFDSVREGITFLKERGELAHGLAPRYVAVRVTVERGDELLYDQTYVRGFEGRAYNNFSRKKTKEGIPVDHYALVDFFYREVAAELGKDFDDMDDRFPLSDDPMDEIKEVSFEKDGLKLKLELVDAGKYDLKDDKLNVGAASIKYGVISEETKIIPLLDILTTTIGAYNGMEINFEGINFVITRL